LPDGHFNALRDHGVATHKVRACPCDGAYEYAVVYAQWGETAKALEWLEAAMRVHEPKLERLRVNPFLDPVRSEPRFQAIERELKFPN